MAVKPPRGRRATVTFEDGEASPGASTEVAPDGTQAGTEADPGSLESVRGPEAIVWRVNAAGARAWLANISPKTVTHQFFAQTFGGGKYWVQIMKPSKRGMSQAAVREIVIDPKIPQRAPVSWDGDDASAPAAIAAPARGPDDNDMRDLLRMQIVEMIKDSTESRQRSNELHNAQMKQISDQTNLMMRTLLDARKDSTPATPPMSMLDMLKLSADARKEMLDLFTTLEKVKGGGGEGGSIERALGLIDTIRKRAKAFGADIDDDGDDRESDGPGGILGELIKAALPYLAGRLGLAPPAEVPQGAIAAPPQPAPVAPAPPPPAAVDKYSFLPPYTPDDPATTNGHAPEAGPVAHPLPAPEPMPAIPVALQFALTSLYEAAQRIEDPKYRAGLIFDFCPEAYKAKLYEEVMRPDALERFFAVQPQFAAHQMWCTKVLEALRGEFADDGEDEPKGAGA